MLYIGLMERIISSNKAKALYHFLKAKKQKIVLVGGVFDIVHPGHVEFLEKAKKQGDVLVVILEADLNVQLRKGKNKPVNPQLHRAKVLAAFKAVDYVILLPFMEKNEDYDEIVKAIQPDLIAITKGDVGIEHKRRTAKLAGARLKVVTSLIEDHSTGKLISKIRQFTETS
jgi:FAD synthetase